MIDRLHCWERPGENLKILVVELCKIRMEKEG
jgi:hypothetical protein